MFIKLWNYEFEILCKIVMFLLEILLEVFNYL